MKRKYSFLLFFFLIVILLLSISTQSFAENNYEKYKIYYNGQSTGDYGFYVKGTPYLPISMIDQYCSNPGISVDTEKMRLNIDMSMQNILFADDEITDFIKNNCGNIYVPLKKLDNEIVFPLNVMEQFFKLSYAVDRTSIKLKAYAGIERIARVNTSSQAAIASLDNDTDDPLPLNLNQRVYISEETNHYYCIEDFDGNKYYINKKYVDIEDLDLSKIDFYAPKKQKFIQSPGEKINLTWQYVNTVTPEAPYPNTAIDILAPTWFRLIVEGDGAVTNGGDLGYTTLSHQNGYMVWATITNNMSETGSTKYTTKVFNDPDLMNKVIAQYIFYSCLYDVDGINIDFEDVVDADRDGLTNFTKNMRYYTEKQGLNLSIDTLIPKPWTIEYDRAALSEYVDYLAIMTYDEHYSGSKTPGSIASIPWVEEAVQESLKEGVPKEKLLMGIPLYTRIWVVDSNNSIISASAATMDSINNILSSYTPTITYLTNEKQNYAEYKTGTHTAKIWLEDEVSITNRLYLVTVYDLAGTACWQYSQASSEIWKVFDRYLK